MAALSLSHSLRRLSFSRTLSSSLSLSLCRSFCSSLSFSRPFLDNFFLPRLLPEALLLTFGFGFGFGLAAAAWPCAALCWSADEPCCCCCCWVVSPAAAAAAAAVSGGAVDGCCCYGGCVRILSNFCRASGEVRAGRERGGASNKASARQPCRSDRSDRPDMDTHTSIDGALLCWCVHVCGAGVRQAHSLAAPDRGH